MLKLFYMNTGMTAHMIVKNEDQWVWFAIQSVLPYVDRFLITDTGSTDQTVKAIKSITSPKIVFSQVAATSPAMVTEIRTRQLKATKTPWIWVVDGDEIYPQATVKEILGAVTKNFEGIVVRRYDLIGDIYHRQREDVGAYELFGHKGHLVTRLVNKQRIPGLHLQGDYPLEGWYDAEGRSTRSHNPKAWYHTAHYLYHAMYLKRSSLGSNLTSVFNRSKYKVETGLPVSSPLPEVFDLPRPSFIPDPKRCRGLAYELAAGIITPIKNIKRKLV